MENLKVATRTLAAGGGYWPAALDPLIESCPEFVAAYLDFARRPMETGCLSAKSRAFVRLALDAASTHLHAPGVRRHVRLAHAAGATKAEVMEVLQLTANLGVHACVLGIPILVEKLAQAGKPVDLSNDDPARQGLKQDFIAKRGYWNPIWDGLLALDPTFFGRFISFSSVPWRTGSLEPKVKEFVYIATNVAAHHQFAPGTHIHIENALGFGATAGELLEVIQIASVVGMDCFEVAMPIVEEEFLRV